MVNFIAVKSITKRNLIKFCHILIDNIMDDKLNLITQKLYNEGVEKAREEAEKILQQAKEEADKIVSDSKSEALNIVSSAKKEAEDIKHKTVAELKLSGDQAMAALKHDVTELISDKIASKATKDSFEDNEFIKKLILAVVEKWNEAEGSLDLNVILSEDIKETTEQYFASHQKALLDKGIEFKSGGDEAKGFVVQPKDGSYQINFTDEVFVDFFRNYLRVFTRDLLFEK